MCSLVAKDPSIFKFILHYYRILTKLTSKGEYLRIKENYCIGMTIRGFKENGRKFLAWTSFLVRCVTCQVRGLDFGVTMVIYCLLFTHHADVQVLNINMKDH